MNARSNPGNSRFHPSEFSEKAYGVTAKSVKVARDCKRSQELLIMKRIDARPSKLVRIINYIKGAL